MSERVRQARNWVASAEADLAAFQARLASGRGMRGQYEDLTVGRALVAAREELAAAEAEVAQMQGAA